MLFSFVILYFCIYVLSPQHLFLLGWLLFFMKNEIYSLLYSFICLYVTILSFLCLYDFYFFHYSWFTVFCQFLLYSKVTQLYIYIYSFSHITFYHVPSQMTRHSSLCCTEDLIAYPLQMQYFASINPKLPVYPTPSPSSLTITSLFSKSMSSFSVERFICAVY